MIGSTSLPPLSALNQACAVPPTQPPPSLQATPAQPETPPEKRAALSLVPPSPLAALKPALANARNFHAQQRMSLADAHELIAVTREKLRYGFYNIERAPDNSLADDARLDKQLSIATKTLAGTFDRRDAFELLDFADGEREPTSILGWKLTVLEQVFAVATSGIQVGIGSCSHGAAIAFVEAVLRGRAAGTALMSMTYTDAKGDETSHRFLISGLTKKPAPVTEKKWGTVRLQALGKNSFIVDPWTGDVLKVNAAAAAKQAFEKNVNLVPRRASSRFGLNDVQLTAQSRVTLTPLLFVGDDGLMGPSSFKTKPVPSDPADDLPGVIKQLFSECRARVPDAKLVDLSPSLAYGLKKSPHVTPVGLDKRLADYQWRVWQHPDGSLSTFFMAPQMPPPLHHRLFLLYDIYGAANADLRFIDVLPALELIPEVSTLFDKVCGAMRPPVVVLVDGHGAAFDSLAALQSVTVVRLAPDAVHGTFQAFALAVCDAFGRVAYDARQWEAQRRKIDAGLAKIPFLPYWLGFFEGLYPTLASRSGKAPASATPPLPAARYA